MEQSQDAQFAIEPSVTKCKQGKGKFIPDEEYFKALEDFKTEFYKVREKYKSYMYFSHVLKKDFDTVSPTLNSVYTSFRSNRLPGPIILIYFKRVFDEDKLNYWIEQSSKNPYARKAHVNKVKNYEPKEERRLRRKIQMEEIYAKEHLLSYLGELDFAENKETKD